MKKQIGVIVLALTLSSAAFAAKNITALDIQTRMAKDHIKRSAFEGKTSQEIIAQNGTHLGVFAKAVGSTAEIVAKNLSRRPDLIEAYMFVDMVQKSSDVTATDKKLAEYGQTILGNYGLAKGIKAEDMAVAKMEAPAVQKFVELLPYLSAMGPKAVEMARVLSVHTADGKSLNEGLRLAASEVLGLKGAELLKFMRDPKEGLANCKL